MNNTDETPVQKPRDDTSFSVLDARVVAVAADYYSQEHESAARDL